MDGTTTYTQFMDQPVSQLDPKELLDLAKKNLKIFGEIEQKQFKRLEAQLKYEKDLDKKEKENRDIQIRRQKELDDLKEKNYKEELERTKKQKENLNRLKENFESDIFEKISSSLNLIPDRAQTNTGEQKNIGEDVMRVSFNKEGIQILKVLLDPIYKALQANTESLDKMLKKITDGERGGSGGGLGWLLMAIGGTLLVLFEQIWERIQRLKTAFDIIKERFWMFIDDIKMLPERIKKFLKLDELTDWIKTKWTKIVDSIKDLSGSIKSGWDEVIKAVKQKWGSFTSSIKEFINFDELIDAFKLKWVSFKDSIKNIFNFDELTDIFKAKWTAWMDGIKDFLNFEGLTKKLDDAKSLMSSSWEKITELFDRFTTTLSKWYDNTKGVWTAIVDSFGEGGIMGKIMTGIKNSFDTVKGVFEDLLKFIEPLLTPLKQFGQWIKPFFRFFDLLLMVVDPITAAVKTLSDVWGDSRLNMLEKTVATLVGAFFGLGDGIFSLIGILSEGVTGIWNWLTGGGWKTENPLGNYMREMTDDYSFGGFGNKMGNTAADVMAEGTNSVALDRMKGIVGMEKSSGVTPMMNNDRKPNETDKDYTMRNAMFDGVIDDLEKKFLETAFDDKGTLLPPEKRPVDDFIMSPKGMSSYIVDRKNNQLYQTAPNDEIIATKKGGIIDKSLEELKMIMSEVNKGILNLNSNISNIQPTVISSNNTTMTGNSENKEYLFKPLFDVNIDKRVQWWKTSREYMAFT